MGIARQRPHSHLRLQMLGTDVLPLSARSAEYVPCMCVHSRGVLTRPAAADRAVWCLGIPCQVREYLEKNWKETAGRDTLVLAVRALMEVVEAGSKNLEIALMEAGTGKILTPYYARPCLNAGAGLTLHVDLHVQACDS